MEYYSSALDSSALKRTTGPNRLETSLFNNNAGHAVAHHELTCSVNIWAVIG